VAETVAEQISQQGGIAGSESAENFLPGDVMGDAGAFELGEEISKKLPAAFSGVGMVAPVAAKRHERGAADAVPVKAYGLPLLIIAGQIDEAGRATGRGGDVQEIRNGFIDTTAYGTALWKLGVPNRFQPFEDYLRSSVIHAHV